MNKRKKERKLKETLKQEEEKILDERAREIEELSVRK